MLEAPVETLPFEAGSFDLMFATDVIEHLDDDVLALRELRRVAADGAHLVLTVPAYRGSGATTTSRCTTAAATRPTAFARASAPPGGDLRSTPTSSRPRCPPWPRCARCGADVRTATRTSDLSLPPEPLNRLLALPVLAEAKAIERGARLPAGVSVGMVCVAD